MSVKTITFEDNTEQTFPHPAYISEDPSRHMIIVTTTDTDGQQKTHEFPISVVSEWRTGH